MAKESNLPSPDRCAQNLWRKVASASDAIGDLITDIPAATVRGEESCRELTAVLGLLKEAEALIGLTAKREEARYTEADGERLRPLFASQTKETTHGQ